MFPEFVLFELIEKKYVGFVKSDLSFHFSISAISQEEKECFLLSVCFLLIITQCSADK